MKNHGQQTYQPMRSKHTRSANWAEMKLGSFCRAINGRRAGNASETQFVVCASPFMATLFRGPIGGPVALDSFSPSGSLKSPRGTDVSCIRSYNACCRSTSTTLKWQDGRNVWPMLGRWCEKLLQPTSLHHLVSTLVALINVVCTLHLPFLARSCPVCKRMVPTALNRLQPSRPKTP